MGKDTFTFDIYTGKDGLPVVHVETPPEWDSVHGPRCRIYLNDESIYEHPDTKHLRYWFIREREARNE